MERRSRHIARCAMVNGNLVMLVAGEGAEDGDLGTWRRAVAKRRRPPQRQTAQATGTGE